VIGTRYLYTYKYSIFKHLQSMFFP
jgi:hypothetical protein